MNTPQGTYAEPIATEQVVTDGKKFFLDLDENARGRFLRITETSVGKRSRIMLPAEAFKDFVESLERMVEFEARI